MGIFLSCCRCRKCVGWNFQLSPQTFLKKHLWKQGKKGGFIYVKCRTSSVIPLLKLTLLSKDVSDTWMDPQCPLQVDRQISSMSTRSILLVVCFNVTGYTELCAAKNESVHPLERLISLPHINTHTHAGRQSFSQCMLEDRIWVICNHRVLPSHLKSTAFGFLWKHLKYFFIFNKK